MGTNCFLPSWNARASLDWNEWSETRQLLPMVRWHWGHVH